MSCSDTGVCDCKPNFVGKQCDECAPDRFNYPLCEECNCNPDGVTETFFTLDGGCAEVPKGELCTCKAVVTGRICDTCKPLFWNLRAATPEEIGLFDGGELLAHALVVLMGAREKCAPFGARVARTGSGARRSATR